MFAFRNFRPIPFCLIVVIIACLFYFGVFNVSKGIGHADLRLHCVVHHAVSDEPLSGVILHIEKIAEDEEHVDPGIVDLTQNLSSNEYGIAEFLLEDVRITTSSGILESDRYFSLPELKITATKPGFEKKVISYMRPKNKGQNLIRHPGNLNLEVPIRLRPELKKTIPKE